MRIFQVSAFFPSHGGGIEVVAGKLAQQFVVAGHEVKWIAGGTSESVRFSDDPVNGWIYTAKSWNYVENKIGIPFPIWDLKSYSKIWKLVKWAQIVHVHDYLYLANILTIIFANFQSKPVVVTQHIGAIPYSSSIASGLLIFLNKQLGARLLSKAAAVVFVSIGVSDYFKKIAKLPKITRVISNGVATDTYMPDFTKHQTQSPRVKFLFVGRFVEKKGLLFLKKCLDIPNVDWQFIGQGPYKPEEWANFLNENSSMVVHRDLRGDALIAYFQAADLLVLPSRGEGFPLVVQEALACGTPVLVSTEVRDTFIRIDLTCVHSVDLTEDNRESNLHSKLSQLSQNRSLLLAGRGPALELSTQWGWDKCAGEYQNIFRELAAVKKDSLK